MSNPETSNRGAEWGHIPGQPPFSIDPERRIVLLRQYEVRIPAGHIALRGDFKHRRATSQEAQTPQQLIVPAENYSN